MNVDLYIGCLQFANGYVSEGVYTFENRKRGEKRKKKKKRKERKEIFNIESGMMLEDITMSQRVVTVNARCVFVIFLFLSFFN